MTPNQNVNLIRRSLVTRLEGEIGTLSKSYYNTQKLRVDFKTVGHEWMEKDVMFPNKLFITFAFSKNNGNMTAIRHLGLGLQIQKRESRYLFCIQRTLIKTAAH